MIYLLRHGCVDTCHPRRFLGQGNPPLNATGRTQARAVGQQLAAIRFRRVYSSPLRRAMETASLVSGRSSAAIEQLPGLAEINLGLWEGLTVAEVEARFPGAYAQRGADLLHFRPAGGENFADLAARSLPVLEELSREPGPLLVVAHSGVNRVLLSELLNRPLAGLLEIPQQWCALNLLSRAGGGLEVTAINRLLYESAERTG